jgi:hypothetical protein
MTNPVSGHIQGHFIAYSFAVRGNSSCQIFKAFVRKIRSTGYLIGFVARVYQIDIFQGNGQVV